METSSANLAAEVLLSGEDLNPKETLEAVVNEIKATEALYVGKARKALVHLAEAAGGSPAPPPAVYGPPPGLTPRPEVNKYIKISATAEPSTLPRDISPSDFHLWMLKFTTYSNASWVPGPPTSGEKLTQLIVYLGTQWQDALETVDQSKATYEEVVKIQIQKKNNCYLSNC